MKPALFTEEELVVELAGRIRRHGDGQVVAYQLGVSQGALSNVLTGGRPIGPRMAKALGYRKRVMFEPIDAAAGALEDVG